MVIKPIFGNGLSISTLNSLEHYILVTMEEPWTIVEPSLNNKPVSLNFNRNTDINHLKKIFAKVRDKITYQTVIVGIGGGTSCDTAKFIVWKYKEDYDIYLDLILIPSIISVDAFLCSSIAVRIDGKVKYIGESKPKEIIIDYDLINKAPKSLNRAGVSDTISIVSALGDWKLERDHINGRFDQSIFNKAKRIALDLMNKRNEIKDITELGIKALIEGYYREVELCEEWGNARPEEGSEHFLSYCLESNTNQHYIHGNLIGMNVLVSLYLQDEYAEFSIEDIKQFFTDIQLNFTPKSQKIPFIDIKNALRNIKKYVLDENLFYSIYNSPKLNLNEKKIDEIIFFLKSLGN